jgi:hypothetical protein
MGIANSVDLPFKKKHSAIAMRDCQLLFQPYNLEELVTILEEKTNSRWCRLPKDMQREMKEVFWMGPLVNPKAREFIARKVSK